jgi:protein O-mannosyl-transferase
MEQTQTSPISTQRWNWRSDLPIVAALLVLTLALYWRVGHYDFINFDDNGYVTDAAHVQAGLTWKSIGWAFTTGAMVNWHPLTWISYMADATFLRARPGPMHLENAIIHAINSALLFVLLKSMTGQRWPSAWAAAMFAWHPLHVESVAWISERKDVLSTFFMLLCILAYVRYVRRPSVGSYSLSLAMLALGLLCKPMIVTLPFVLLLLDFWPLRRLSDPSTSPPRILSRNPRNALLIEKLPMFFVISLDSAAAFWVQFIGHSVVTTDSIPLQLRLANAIVSYVKYLQATILPLGLALFYPHPGTLPTGHISAANIVAWVAVLVIVSLVAVLSRRAMPWILVGWLWYLGTLVPVIGLVQVGGQARADRYTYIPLVGVFIAAGWLGAWLAKASHLCRLAISAIGITACAAAMIVSWRQIGYWQDSETVLRHAIDVVPDNYMAHSNLGEAFDARHEVEKAAKEYRIVLQIKPEDPIALADLAIHAADRGDTQQAIDFYERSLRHDQTSAPTFNNYGNLLSNIGRGDDAAHAFRRALALDPDAPKIYHNFALARAREGKISEAIPLWQKAIELKPDYTAAHFGLAQALLLARNDRQAIAEFKAALATAPDRVDILANLAWVLATNSVPEFRDGAQALRLAQRACELSNNNDALALDSLAAALARVGQFQPAVQNAHLAAEVAARQNLTELSPQIARRISLYEKGEPYTSGN